MLSSEKATSVVVGKINARPCQCEVDIRAFTVRNSATTFIPLHRFNNHADYVFRVEAMRRSSSC